ncbi:hypothetical protein SCHPADRAFT_895447 [Schizopora paradoxa]|uniref:Uncharacterized protein n=1 Tax=Schizopora paradoxa TaxID=27342 RepID=A0A0H2R3R2_9AGAM|nr:hypothetical protein SCHPADRAFT_895447 [Schizopora paradoxa]
MKKNVSTLLHRKNNYKKRSGNGGGKPKLAQIDVARSASVYSYIFDSVGTIVEVGDRCYYTLLEVSRYKPTSDKKTSSNLDRIARNLKMSGTPLRVNENRQLNRKLRTLALSEPCQLSGNYRGTVPLSLSEDSQGSSASAAPLKVRLRRSGGQSLHEWYSRACSVAHSSNPEPRDATHVEQEAFQELTTRNAPSKPSPLLAPPTESTSTSATRFLPLGRYIVTLRVILSMQAAAISTFESAQYQGFCGVEGSHWCSSWKFAVRDVDERASESSMPNPRKRWCWIAFAAINTGNLSAALPSLMGNVLLDFLIDTDFSTSILIIFSCCTTQVKTNRWEFAHILYFVASRGKTLAGEKNVSTSDILLFLLRIETEALKVTVFLVKCPMP